MGTLIKRGTIVTATDSYRSDILIENEKIAVIGSGLEARADNVIDAKEKYIFPGGIDGHTHFRFPFMGTKTTGFDTTPAAAVGGTTTVIDFAPQSPGMSLLDSIAKHREEEAENVSVVDYGFHAMVMDLQERVFDEIPLLAKAGIPTIKLFMAYKGSPVYCTDSTVFRMLQKTKRSGMLTMLHAENGEIIEVMQKQLLAQNKRAPKYHAVSRPPVVEEEATIRATMLAKAAETPVFIVHVSCKEAMEAVRSAQERGISAFGETCPHYLTLDVANLSKPGFEGAKFVCSPALRETRHHDELWRALHKGWLQTVGSDHCSFNYKGQKDMGKGDFTKIPNGAPGMENRLAILYTYGVLTGKLPLTRLIDVFATAPAKFFGCYPRKGSITVGADADIVIFDPAYECKISVKTSLQGIDYNAFEGFKQRGRAEQVFLRGQRIVDKGKFVGKAGQGKFIKREPYGFAYEGV